ncbi:MAG: polyprenyl synthetase family protein [Acidimicrobiales bacterium]
MTSDPGFLDRVAARIGNMIEEGRTRYGGFDPEIDSLFGRLSALTENRGKGTRADAVRLGWLAAGGTTDDPTPVNIGAAFELLHLSALVHDDMIDGSSSRRGVPTVHVEAAERHRIDGLAGSSAHFATGSAVLTGNILAALAQSALGEVNAAARHEWSRVQLEVNLGQYLDLVSAAGQTMDEDRVHTVMRLKTAAYTFARPLRTGAAATGRADEMMLDDLGAYGHLVGVAFQIRDDILGVFGDESVTGKPAGDDLREGKATLLLLRSGSRPENIASGVFVRVGSPDLMDGEIELMRSTIELDGTLKWAEEEAQRYVDKATSQLGRWSGEIRKSLEELARSAVERRR